MTEPFQGYICWTPANVNDTVSVDAVSPSPAVFLATHRPSQMLRRDFSATSGGVLIEEEQLLQEFLAPNPGMLFLPIVGDSGTGKSHLVRWLQLRLPPSGSRKVVYIPKYGTNLRRVIELILSDMTGDAVDDLRSKLAEAADAMDEAGAPSRLLNELASSIEDRSREPRPSPARPHDEYRQWLEVELPKLLLDNVFRSKLLEPDGVISRLVKEALKGKQDDDKSHPFAFTDADLPLSVADASRANLDVQTLFGQLIDSPTLREVSIELLNDNLGPAIRTLFGMGGTRLSEVMFAVRRELLAQGMELVLLVEDFTILQGIQRELLDAITEAPVRSGRQELCSIRMAMAVTTGYFATIAQTFSTRAEFTGHVFSLDVALSQTGRGVAPDDVADFVAGYLNASRLGQAHLEEALREAGTERAMHRRWVPNACHECPHSDACHEAFGVSRDGFGLYPFNAPALGRAVESRSPKNFDPRRILGSVVRYTLDQQRADIVRGEFPSRAFALQFAAPSLPVLDADLAEDLRSMDAVNADRRVVLLTFWGGRPTKVVNLPAGIHEAFAIPELKDTEIQRPPRRAGGLLTVSTASPAGPVGAPPLPPLLQLRLADIDQWSNGTKDLDQALARDVRRFLHAAVVAHIDWNDELLQQTDDSVGPQAGKFFRQASIDIDKAQGSGAYRPDSAVTIHLPMTTESATLFRSIVLAQHYGHWAFDRGDERLRRLTTRLDTWSREVVATVRAGRSHAGTWDLVASATELLAFTARILNLPGAHSHANADLASALLTDVIASVARRNNRWDKLADACASDNRRKIRDALLARIGARQGNGRAQAIDITALVPTIATFRRTWTLTEPPDEAPGHFQRLYREIQRWRESAISDELTRLGAWHERVTAALDPTASPAEVADAVVKAAQAAMQAGSFEPPRLRNELEEAARAFRRTRYSVIREVGDLVAQAPTLSAGRLLSDLATDRSRPMADIDRFVSQATQAIDASSARARQLILTYQAGGGGNADLTALQGALEAIQEIMQETSR
jgi:hypothetical protein